MILGSSSPARRLAAALLARIDLHLPVGHDVELRPSLALANDGRAVLELTQTAAASGSG